MPFRMVSRISSAAAAIRGRSNNGSPSSQPTGGPASIAAITAISRRRNREYDRIDSFSHSEKYGHSSTAGSLFSGASRPVETRRSWNAEMKASVARESSSSLNE